MPNGYTYRNRNTRDEVTYPAPSVRLDHLPNWERIAEPEPEPEPVAEPPADPDEGQGQGQGDDKGDPALFAPADHTVDEVLAHLAEADEDERARVLAAEADGKARTTVIGKEADDGAV